MSKSPSRVRNEIQMIETVSYASERELKRHRTFASKLRLGVGVDTLDPLLAPWIYRINKIHGVATCHSCQGHGTTYSTQKRGDIHVRMSKPFATWWKMYGAAKIAMDLHKAGAYSFLVATVWYPDKGERKNPRLCSEMGKIEFHSMEMGYWHAAEGLNVVCAVMERWHL